MHTNLQRLSAGELRSLAAALRDGVLAAGISAHAVRQVTGACGLDVAAELVLLHAAGWDSVQIALLADAIADAKDSRRELCEVLDLVLSGPEVPGVPTADTAAVDDAGYLLQVLRDEGSRPPENLIQRRMRMMGFNSMSNINPGDL